MENVTVEYTLATNHNVFFELTDGSPVKQVSRSCKVGKMRKTIEHRVKMVEHGGTPGQQANVKVSGKVKSESPGSKTRAWVLALEA